MERKSNFLVSYQTSAGRLSWGEGPTVPQPSFRGEERAFVLKHKEPQCSGLEEVIEDAFTKRCMPDYPKGIVDGQNRPFKVLLGSVNPPVSLQVLLISNGQGAISIMGSSLWLHQFHASHGADHGASAQEDQLYGNQDFNMGGCSTVDP